MNITRLLQNGKVSVLIAVSLALHSFGWKWCFYALVCVFFFLLGSFLQYLFHVLNVRWPLLLEELDSMNIVVDKKFLLDKTRPNNNLNKGAKLPCSESVEKLINEILVYITRDFVSSWYANVSNDETFPRSVRLLLTRAARMVILHLKKVNWVTLLTHDLIDDFATHLRIFRKAKQKCQRHATNNEPLASGNLLERYFFEVEYELEKRFCRKNVATSKSGQNEHLRSLADIINYLLVPPKDLTPKMFRLILRDVVAKHCLEACFDLFSDPDYIYSTIAYQLSNVTLKYEDFTTILQATDDPEELNAVMESLQQEIRLQRSKDTGGADDESIKQQLSSLYYLEKLINSRRSHMAISDTRDEEEFGWQDRIALYDLSLAFVLCNHVALCSFIDYLSQTDGKSYIDMYLTVEGFKNSFLRIPYPKNTYDFKYVDPLIITSAQEVATDIYNQYFETKSSKLVDIDEGIKKRLQASIKNKMQHPSLWFDEAQKRAFEILENDLRFYPSFKRNYAYVKLLAELKLLTFHDGALAKASDDAPFANVAQTGDYNSDSKSAPLFSTYETSIKTIGMGNDQSNIFAVYNIMVKKFDHRGECVKHWVVTRRYSDFYNLNCLIKRKFPQLARISFPAKKTFNNMHQGFLNNRKRSLNTYLRTLLDPALLKRCGGLEDMLKDFLSQPTYNCDTGSFANKLTSVVDPIRSGVKFVGNAVISMPDTLLDGVCRVGDGLGRVTRTVFRIQESAPQEEGKCGRVADSLNYESADSIPLRILMLLMDEIFGLREKNQWIRRQMVSFLQQLIHATYGSSLNRKIIQYVRWLTSEEQVISYIKLFKNSMWPNGLLAAACPAKASNAKARTRVVAKTQILSVLPDEFKLFIGNETARQGVEFVFEALQYENLNRRLCHVFLERLLVSTFPGRNLDQVITLLLQKRSSTDLTTWAR